MSAINAATRAYLTDYLKSPAGFAVMLSAPWGAGKTYFIRDYFEAEEPRNHLLVSLFGVGDRKGIERAIALELFNGADGEVLERFGNGAADVLKKLTGVNLTVRLEDLARTRLPKTLIFDDLERSGLNPPDLLGALNGFVERDGKHVILLTNEAKLFEDGDAREVKEKTVGITLPIEPDFDAAFPSLIKTVSETGRAFLQAQQEQIRDVFATAGFDNLRSLGQALWEFDRLFQAASERQRGNAEGMAVLLRHYLIFCLEYKAGTIDGAVMRARDAFSTKRDDPLQKKLQDLSQKYSVQSLGYGRAGSDFPTDLALRTIIEGAVLPTSVQEAIKRTPLFREADTELPWRSLWSARWRSKNDVEVCYKDVVGDLSEGKFRNPFEALHIFSTFLSLREAGIETRNVDAIVKLAKAYFGKMLDGDLVFDNADTRLDLQGWAEPFESYDGLGYPVGESARAADFRRIWHEFAKARAKAAHRILAREAHGLAKRLCKNPDEAMLDLLLNGRQAARFASVPVLAEIATSEMVTEIFCASPFGLRKVSSLLKQRLQPLRPELEPERAWLARVKSDLDAKAEDLDTFAKWQLAPFQNALAEILQNTDE